MKLVGEAAGHPGSFLVAGGKPPQSHLTVARAGTRGEGLHRARGASRRSQHLFGYRVGAVENEAGVAPAGGQLFFRRWGGSLGMLREVGNKTFQVR